jgi:hypothetical protein
VDTNEKKVELFRKGLSAQLQKCLVLFCDLAFNALVSATIDHEGASRTYLEAEAKKRKRVMSGPSGGGSRGAPLKYHLVYTLANGTTMSSSATTVGPSPIVPPLVVAALAADVPSCSHLHVAGSTVLGTTTT